MRLWLGTSTGPEAQDLVQGLNRNGNRYTVDREDFNEMTSSTGAYLTWAMRRY